MGDEVDSFLEYLKDIKRYSLNTLIAYSEDLNQFVEFCEKVELIQKWSEVTSGMVRRFGAGLMAGTLEFGEGEKRRKVKPQSAKSVNRKLSSLRSMFRYLIREGVVEMDPVELVNAPKIRKKLPVFVPDDEMDELLDEGFEKNDFASFRDWMILKIAYCTGMRRSELAALKIEDIDMEAKVIKVVGKGDKERMIPMLDELVFDIRSYLAERELNLDKEKCDSTFFITDAGLPASAAYVAARVKKQLNKVRALSKRSTHVLRHSFATALLNNGAESEAIRKLLGHESLAATQIYTHNSFEKLKQVYNEAFDRPKRKGGDYGNQN